MNRKIALGLLVVLLLGLSSLGGCRKIRFYVGWPEEVTNAPADSPEAVIQDALRAALEKGESKAWRQFRDLLHKDSIKTGGQRKLWRNERFARMRRQIKNYIRDPGLPSYALIGYKVLDSGEHVLLLESSASKVGTPCTLMRDAQKGWKIKSCSL